MSQQMAHVQKILKKKLCDLTRKILEKVDWNCEVQTLFRETYLDCRQSLGGAIKWFFEQEPEGIILEDDCLPTQSFFWFCQELLDISGTTNKFEQFADSAPMNWTTNQALHIFFQGICEFGGGLDGGGLLKDMIPI